MSVAYAVVIREKTRNAARLHEYKKILPAIFQKHPATFLVNHGRYEVADPLHKIESTGRISYFALLARTACAALLKASHRRCRPAEG